MITGGGPLPGEALRAETVYQHMRRPGRAPREGSNWTVNAYKGVFPATPDSNDVRHRPQFDGRQP